ncbi:hypothetical protein RUE5091_03747 [Ruegeria denitrificans]|uniref:SnoaL-like domain-containing protein n=1 Tax=Ruegeria denitrificans TaxID=1715692 RepID=A0A0P1II51_9RHOB|nr:nuclear transport factor 2 family protein [Ruegeria denitrificans]CUK14227.1 hypothetical protein RUE5091_03747 [Ruegeria denitrificans]
MFSEARYQKYIRDFNSTFVGGMSLPDFFDKYYEQDATFEYVPQARKNVGRAEILEFWGGVGDKMQEVILSHTHYLANETTVASEAPIDFLCREDLEWNGVPYKAGTKFRLMMCAFYDVSSNNKFTYVRVYSIYNPGYAPDP